MSSHNTYIEENFVYSNAGIGSSSECKRSDIWVHMFGNVEVCDRLPNSPISVNMYYALTLAEYEWNSGLLQ